MGGLLLAMLLALAPSICMAQDAQLLEKTDSLLLVYSTGTELEGFGGGVEGVAPEALDAVSGPTPVGKNTQTAALKIQQGLSARGVSVRLARVEDFTRKGWRELMRYNTIVIGTPTRFGNMGWEMKRFMDEVVHQIFMQVPEKARGIQFALFATGGFGNEPDKAIATMDEVVSDCNGQVIGRLGMTTRQSDDEIDQQIAKFCGVVSILVN